MDVGTLVDGAHVVNKRYIRLARYIGTHPKLRGCEGIIARDRRSRRHVFAQMTCMRPNGKAKVWPLQVSNFSGLTFCSGWHRFKRSEFHVLPLGPHSYIRKLRRQRVDAEIARRIKLAKMWEAECRSQ